MFLINPYIHSDTTPKVTNVMMSETGGTYSLSYTYLDNTIESNKAPFAESVTITGTLTDTSTLTATLDEFKSYNDATEGTHLYQWYYADDKYQLNEVTIGGGTSSTFVLTGTQIGKYMRCEITPVETGGNNNGEAISSIFTNVITS